MMCQEVVEYMHRQLDGDLNEHEQEILMKHTKHCPDCAALFDRLQKLSAELENLPRVMPKYSLVDAIMPQLEQLEPIVRKAAADEGISQEPARRVKPARKWPALRALSGAVAAAAVAGIFIVSYNTGLFQSGSSNDSAQESATMDTAAPFSAKRMMTEDEHLKQYAADKSAGDVNVESMAPDVPAGETEEMPLGISSNEQTESDMDGGAAPTSNSSGSMESTSEPSVSGGGEDERGIVPPIIQAESSDGVYTAQVYGYVIRLFKSGESEVLFETTRKNGKIANLSWSEDNKELFYEIQLESGGMERYVVDVSTHQETKAPH